VGYLGPKCRKCRQLNFSVCGSERCALSRRDTRPGMHPFARGRMSDYKMRLLEKQKLRYSYWVSERQLRGYVKKALSQYGKAGENLLRLLERRLDNLVYRLGFAPSIPAARQLVVHGHIMVNGDKVDRPSYGVRPGEKVSLKESSKKMVLVQEALVRSQARPELSYVKADRRKLLGSLIAIPRREEIPLPIDEGLVVEYYAKYI
jgi:small subunit ribosomal protein S4